jgi:hypothetical protein
MAAAIAGLAAAGVQAAWASGSQVVLNPYLVTTGPGAPAPGGVLSVEPGVWSPPPASFQMRWQRCVAATLSCTDIAGAAGPEYRVAEQDLGATLRAVVWPAAAGGAGATTATSPVVAGAAGDRPGGGGAPGGGMPDERTGAGGAGRLVTGAPARLLLRFGSLAAVRGTLTRLDGDPAGDEAVELRDPSGLPAAAARTGGEGGFTVAARFTRPGSWMLAGEGWHQPVTVRLRPGISVGRVTRRVTAPGVVRVTGRLAPGVAGKLVQLQFLDPGRGWRLWRQTPTRPGGRFTLARLLKPNPHAPHYTLRVRVAVPADVGWPFAPAVSAAMAVRVE